MYKIIILSIFVVGGVCGNNSTSVQARGNSGHHHHHFYKYYLYHAATYIAFFAIKFKLILFFSIMFAVFVIGGKLDVLIKYIAKKESSHEHPVYIQAPSHHHDWHRYSKKRSNENNIYDNYEIFARMIKELNTTEMAFKAMNFTTTDCKKRFVCEAHCDSKHSIILQAGFDIISDEAYSKYKTEKPVKSKEECGRLYPDCENYEEKLK